VTFNFGKTNFFLQFENHFAIFNSSTCVKSGILLSSPHRYITFLLLPPMSGSTSCCCGRWGLAGWVCAGVSGLCLLPSPRKSQRLRTVECFPSDAAAVELPCSSVWGDKEKQLHGQIFDQVKP